MSSNRREALLSVLTVVLSAALVYGAMMSGLGFYRDDWYLVWTWQARGASGLLEIFSVDRPFDGWMYILDFTLLGVSPLRWQIYALIIKTLSALAFLWLLRSLWEERRAETTLMALLFLVYPGFFQQPNALTFKQLLLSIGLALLSLALTINAAKTPRKPLKILFAGLALLSSAIYMLIYEALVGYEAVRLILLLYLFLRQNQGWKRALQSAFWNFLPYAVFAASFLYWRLFLFEAKRKSTNVENIAGAYQSLHGWIGRLVEYAKDFIEINFLAWGTPLYQFWNQALYREIGTAAAIALGALLLAGGYLLLTRRDGQESENAGEQDARDWALLGGLLSAVTLLPVVAAGRNVLFAIQWDRYSYQSAFGAALLAGGLSFYAFKGKTRRALLALLLACGAMTQAFSASFYRAFWKIEREAWWQLSWRAPQIEDGTNLILSLPGGYALAEEYEVWGPANLIYFPQDSQVILTGQIPYDGVWVELARGSQLERIVRGSILVAPNYEKSLIAAQSAASSCLRVLDGRRAEQAVSERAELSAIARYSRVGLIRDSVPAVPPREIFGDEPPRGWCYYYQKMDLARQMEDWQSAAALADEAASLGLAPNDFSEWLPALEAYLRVGDEKNAKRLVRVIRADTFAFQGLCARYKDLRGQPAEYDRAALFEALCVR